MNIHHTTSPITLKICCDSSISKPQKNSHATNINLFQIFYTPETLSKVDSGFIPMNNLNNPRPDWYEYWPIRDYLLNEKLDDDAFYGFFSTKFYEKTGLRHEDVVDFVQQRSESADVMLFSPQPDMGAFFLNVFEQNETFDPGFTETCQNFLKSIGIDFPLLNIVMDSRQIVFSNFFVARAPFWRAWLDLNEKLFALCENMDSDISRELRKPTTYPGYAQRKVFVQERMASLLLTTDRKWRSVPCKPFKTAWSNSKLRNYPTEVVISDALKLAFRENHTEEYISAFSKNRACLFQEKDAISDQNSDLKIGNPHVNIYKSLASQTFANIPVIIPSFNNPTYVKNMVSQLQSLSLKNIIIIDNASSSEDMQCYLKSVSSDISVIQLDKNYGPHYTFIAEQEYQFLPSVFCLSDPDLRFNKNMPASFIHDLFEITEKFEVGKAGLALDISEPSTMKKNKVIVGSESYYMWEWESRFWKNNVGEMADGSIVYKANIDTTFALYNKKYFRLDAFYDAYRVAGRYTCQHIPWHNDNELQPDEELIYRETQKFSTCIT